MAEPSDPSGRIRLVVLFGGRSAEHDVSRVTARHVLAALDPDRYVVDAVGIDRDGRWHRSTPPELGPGAPALPDALEVGGEEVDPAPALRSGSEPVVALPLLHGPFGEDGTVQGLLELADVPYVGSGVLGSAVAMDKAVAKELAAAAGIPQARWRALHADDWTGALGDELVVDLGLPLFVKPANMGSSIGVSRVEAREDLDAAVATAARYDEVLVIEEGVAPAREIEVAVLGNRSPTASVPGEIRPGAAFYDYDDKYRDGAAELLVPAPLPDDVAEEARALALRSFAALRCEGLARVDFLYEDGGRGLLLNEVNTMPGFTPISMYPKLWAASGLPYGELLDRLVELALERHARRGAHRSTT